MIPLNDQEIDAYITRRINELGVTLYDICGGQNIDPEPDNWAKPYKERVRCNRFTTDYFDTRLCELLTEGEFDPYRPFDNLAVPLKDIIRYWWNNISDQEEMISEILDAVMTHFKDRMLPDEPE